MTSFAGPGWKTFVPAGASPTVETVEKVDALRTADRNRAFDLTQCVVADVTNAAAYIVRAILQIRSAASACPEPKACAINIMKLGCRMVKVWTVWTVWSLTFWTIMGQSPETWQVCESICKCWMKMIMKLHETAGFLG